MEAASTAAPHRLSIAAPLCTHRHTCEQGRCCLASPVTGCRLAAGPSDSVVLRLAASPTCRRKIAAVRCSRAAARRAAARRGPRRGSSPKLGRERVAELAGDRTRSGRVWSPRQQQQPSSTSLTSSIGQALRHDSRSTHHQSLPWNVRDGLARVQRGWALQAQHRCGQPAIACVRQRLWRGAVSKIDGAGHQASFRGRLERESARDSPATSSLSCSAASVRARGASVRARGGSVRDSVRGGALSLRGGERLSERLTERGPLSLRRPASLTEVDARAH